MKRIKNSFNKTLLQKNSFKCFILLKTFVLNIFTCKSKTLILEKFKYAINVRI